MRKDKIRLETLPSGTAKKKKKKKGNETERKVNKKRRGQVRLMVDYESSIETSSLSTKRVQSIISVNFRMEKMATTVN